MAQASQTPDTAFEFESHVRYSEVDCKGRLSLPAVIDYFQDCSTFHSETLGLGIEHLHQHGRAWVLTHWHIVATRYPHLCEPIAVGTFATSCRGLMAYRNFYLTDRDHTMLIRANSCWILLDLATGKPCRPQPEEVEPYGSCEPLSMPAESRRIRLVEDQLAPAEPLVVQSHHIDMNGHVNNCEYVRMALELSPTDTTWQQVRVDYKRQATLGEHIYPVYAYDDMRLVVDLRDEQGGSFATVELSDAVLPSAIQPSK